MLPTSLDQSWKKEELLTLCVYVCVCVCVCVCVVYARVCVCAWLITFLSFIEPIIFH